MVEMVNENDEELNDWKEHMSPTCIPHQDVDQPTVIGCNVKNRGSLNVEKLTTDIEKNGLDTWKEWKKEDYHKEC